MSERLHFSIDSAFLTNIAREWFWSENRPYEKCEELLMCCLSTDDLTLNEKHHICQDVIEGRKKFVGVDVCSIVEDGVHIRPISEKIQALQHDILISRIRDDMEAHPFRYIDPFSLDRDFFTFLSEHSEDDYDFVQGLIYQLDTFHNPGDIFDNGTWLFERPSLIADLNGDVLTDPEKTSDMYQNGFWKKLYDWVSVNLGQDAANPYVMRRQKLYRRFVGLEQSNQQTFGSIYGLIAPDGTWYDCDYAEHTSKAGQIIRSQYDPLGITKEDSYSVLVEPLDYLYDKGWIALRNPLLGCRPYIDMKDLAHATKAQINTVFDYINHYSRYDLDTSQLMSE